MREFGLIGFPLSHSFSQHYFTEKFKKENIAGCVFRNFPMEDIQDLPLLIKENPFLRGISVTIPYKQHVIPLLDALNISARETGAVNCIKIDMSNGTSIRKMTGYNTDIYGIEHSLTPLLKPIHKKALVLGTGGASKAVQYVFKKLSIEYLLVSRTPESVSSEKITGYDKLDAEVLSKHLLIVNTTPLGMYPHTETFPPLPYHVLTAEHFLFDLVYNPAETIFLKKGNEKGCMTKNGLGMLQLQAEKAWEIWNH